MDQILNIDNNETKSVGVSNESSGITGAIDFLSDKSNSANPTPTSSPIAKPEQPSLGVIDSMGIIYWGQLMKKKVRLNQLKLNKKHLIKMIHL